MSKYASVYYLKEENVLKQIIKLSVAGGQMVQHLPLAGLGGIGFGHVGTGHSTALQSTLSGSMNTQQVHCRALVNVFTLSREVHFFCHETIQ